MSDDRADSLAPAQRLARADAACDTAITAGDATLRRAWALKDDCYAAWSTDPRRAARIADSLGELRRSRVEPHQAREIAALAAWTEGIAHMTQGRMAEGVQALDAAASIFGELGQPQHAAQTRVPKIMALSLLGQFGAAIECAEDTHRAFVTLGDKLGAAKVSLNLANLHGQRGRYAQATEHARAASVLFARAGDHERSVQADIGLANALTDVGDFEEASRIYARARMRASAHDYPVLQTMVDEAVGLLHLARGRFRDALGGLESARRQYELLRMPHHVAIAEKQLADAYLELRLLPEALALYEQVLARLHTLDVPDEVAWALSQRGRVQALLGRTVAAVESFEAARSLFAEHGIGIGEAAVCLARAELMLEGGNPAMATRLAARAGETFDAAGRVEARVRSDVVRAHALLRAGSVEQARSLFATTGAIAHTLRLSSMQVRCRVGQGLAAQAMGDDDAARAAYLDAVEQFEVQRRALPGDDLRSAFLTDHLLPFRELLRLALKAHADAPTPATAEAIVEHLEHARARSLADRVHDAGAPTDRNDGTLALRERLNWLYRRVHRLDGDQAPPTTLTDELRRTEHELLERARRARMTCGVDIAGEQAAVLDAFGVAGLRSQLAAGDAIVEYGVLDDELFACVISTDGVGVERHVASWGETQEAMRAARFQIETLRHGSQSVQQHLDSLTLRATKRLQRVHDLVWQPIAPRVARCRRLMIVPCGALASLPFAALPIASRSGQPRVLAERFALAVVPSARLAWHGLRRVPCDPRHVVALGESSRLAHAAVEAGEVSALFESCTTLVGDRATVQAFGTHAPSADVLHLACHAQFRGDNPRFSALHLHDAALSVEAVERMTLRPCTVVLSACDTGLDEGDPGEEHVGLVRAFLAAGAARVLASLWTVDDATTAVFMRNFYDALHSGRSAADALRQAQLRCRASHAHPFYWAAFTLSGGW